MVEESKGITPQGIYRGGVNATNVRGFMEKKEPEKEEKRIKIFDSSSELSKPKWPIRDDENKKEGEFGFTNALAVLGESGRTKLEKRVREGPKGQPAFNPGKSFKKHMVGGEKGKEREEVEPGT